MRLNGIILIEVCKGGAGQLTPLVGGKCASNFQSLAVRTCAHFSLGGLRTYKLRVRWPKLPKLAIPPKKVDF